MASTPFNKAKAKPNDADIEELRAFFREVLKPYLTEHCPDNV